MDSPDMWRRWLWLSLAAAGSLLLLILRAGYKPVGAATAQPQTPETALPDIVAATGRIEPAERVTLLMVATCVFSGALAMRRSRMADPAGIF
jgi:hypothetical protein